MKEPLYRVWITGEERPRPWYKDHAGHWAAEEAWPSPRIDWRTLHLNEGRLAAEARQGVDLTHASPATAGTDFGRWGGYGGTFFWIDPKEQVIGLLMAQTPGASRQYYRRMIKTLVYQAIE